MCGVLYSEDTVQPGKAMTVKDMAAAWGTYAAVFFLPRHRV